ncbi:Glycoside hydrolase family 5 protein [Mycena kentingensis (nom. inval.)]|nr:Glycoside hydrolase family 5 protein [Mycena kentingensis (nom. inval.)]
MLGKSLVLAALLVGNAWAVVPEFGQCGGQSYSGDTVCATGLVCAVLNPFFFQCLRPSQASTFTTVPFSTTAPASTTQGSTTSRPASTTSAPPSSLTGFVKATGKRFTLNGAAFPVTGTNAYWPALLGFSPEDNTLAFQDIKKTGATVVRTEAFNECTLAQSSQFICYNIWNGTSARVNTAAGTGLGTLDVLIAAAKAQGIRVILVLTNNWSDFGGMDVYTSQILGSGQAHDVFYTNPTVIAAFKTYVRAIVTRYANEPAVFAWELANEPRCAGTSTVASSTCTPATITTWAKDISAFIKSIDPNHMVAIGDEGFFNEPGSHNFDFVYQGTLGIDFAANMQISTIDFGTFHMYPESWGHAGDPLPWGQQWILDHAAVMNTTNKPVLMEEYGLQNVQGTARLSGYQTWWSTIVSSGVTGDLYWHAGSTFPDGRTSPQDGLAIFPTDPVFAALPAHATAVKARG